MSQKLKPKVTLESDSSSRQATDKWQSLLQLKSRSSVLITSAQPGIRDCGTGFCLERIGAGVLVATCAHVVTSLGSQRSQICVNGYQVTGVQTAEDRGIDLALLTVPELPYVCTGGVRIAKALPEVGEVFSAIGYSHLHGKQYISRQIRGEITDRLIFREQLSKIGVPAVQVAAAKDFAFTSGNSGSAIFGSSGDLIGILAYARQDGLHGYALSALSLNEFLLDSRLAEATISLNSLEASAEDANRPLPPELPKIIYADDLQRGRFGGLISDGVVELYGIFHKAVGSSYFTFDVGVKSIASGVSLRGPAIFFLHDTFPRPRINIEKPDSTGAFVLMNIHSYGVFTVGCQVYASDRRWHCVEYNIANLEKLPPEFLVR